MAFQFQIAQPPLGLNRIMTTVANLGLTTNLKLCLDAGDISSVASASQTKWLDVSGNGYDFFRGVDGTAEANEPTFAGTLGRQSSSEYALFPGQDNTGRFTYDTASETWMDALHKDNAAWTMATWVFLPAHNTTALHTIFGTVTNTGPGVSLVYTGDNDTLTLLVLHASGTAYSATLVSDIDVAAWKFVSVTIDEAGNALRWNISGTQSSTTCTYTTPSSSAAATPMRIGHSGLSLGFLFAGTRMNSLLIWQGTALSAANVDSLFQATRSKFGV